MKKLRVVQVGVGGFGNYRRQAMRETGLFELVAAFDINADALANAQKEDGAKPVSSYKELLAQPGIEAVIISTGGKFHAEQALQAMERGLHVFVEKPLCSTPAEARALLEAQRKAGVVGGMGHNDHSNDAIATTIKRLISDGTLGKIVTFEKTTAHSGGMQIRPGDWRGDPDKNPGGMLFQCGVHALHELMFFFGPVSEVVSLMRYDVHTTQTADVACCILKFTNGLVGTLNAYHVTPYRHAVNFFGTKANIYREDLSFEEGTKMWFQETHLDGKQEPKQPLPIEGKSDVFGNLRSFYNAIRNGGTCYPSLLDGARAVEVVFAAEESAKTGRVTKVTNLA